MANAQESTISYLGPEGTYTEKASIQFGKRLGLFYNLVPHPTVYSALSSVADYKADFAVMPWMNSVDGLVGSNIDDLLELNDFLKITDEVVVPIKHYLAVKEGTNTADVEKVYSHSSALQQCRKKLHKRLPNALVVPSASTAEAARQVNDGDGKGAAICSTDAVQKYGLEILDSDIQDYSTNETRFYVCSTKDHARTGNDRTLIAVKYGTNNPGLLYETLGQISPRQINLYRIESRPYKYNTEEPVMLLWLDGHRTDELKDSLDSIRDQMLKTNGWLRVLGSYPVRKNNQI